MPNHLKISIALILMISVALYAKSSTRLDQAIKAYDAGEYQKAGELFALTDIKQSLEAQYYLGMMYAEGLNGEIDKPRALIYLKTAAKSLDKAQFHLGWQYYHGLVVEKNRYKAVEWWLKAAKKNHALAQYYLGIAYFLGQGVDANSLIAKKWYTLAVQNGNVQAQRALSLLLQDQSIEIPFDLIKATDEPEKAVITAIFKADNALFKQLSPVHYVAQLLATTDEDAALLLKEKYALKNLYLVSYKVKNEQWFALVQGNYLSKQAAIDGIAIYADKTPNLKPWIRPIAHIQKLIQ